MKLTKVEEKVKYLTDKYPITRENYNVLTYYYWTKIDGVMELTPRNLMRATSSESITRCFRKLVEQGTIAVTHETKMRRMNQEIQVREYVQPTFIGNTAYIEG